MPFVLIGIGILVLVVGIRGTQSEFLSLLKGDFTGESNFIYWVIAVLVVGSVGYIPKLKPLANTFLMLIILVLFISNRGFFEKFNQQIKEVTS